MSTMAEDDIIAALVPIRGIGRWTVEMMLMFRLGRADVLPVDDLGIRKGAQEVDRLEAMPTPKELAARSESWGPYRTYASLYLWRIARAEEHTSELQSLMRISYAVFCLKQKTHNSYTRCNNTTCTNLTDRR